MSINDLEPAARDPKKLRNTALVLVAVMVLGGWLVLQAYEKWSAKAADSDRPAIIHQIRPERSLMLIRQDGTVADLVDLRGHVYVLNIIDLGLPESQSTKVMESLSEDYADDPAFNLVTLVIDSIDANEVGERLRQEADKRGMELPKWWLGTNEAETLRKFIRKELKPSIMPDQIDGEWHYDPSIILVDKDDHLRRAVIPYKDNVGSTVVTFDFDQAAKWDADGKLSGTNLTNVEQLEVLLRKTIDRLLDEPAPSS